MVEDSVLYFLAVLGSHFLVALFMVVNPVSPKKDDNVRV